MRGIISEIGIRASCKRHYEGSSAPPLYQLSQVMVCSPRISDGFHFSYTSIEIRWRREVNTTHFICVIYTMMKFRLDSPCSGHREPTIRKKGGPGLLAGLVACRRNWKARLYWRL